MHARVGLNADGASGGDTGGSDEPVDAAARAYARLYGRIVDATGWTYRQIDELSVAEALELVDHWNEAPPLVECVRAYFGLKPAQPQESKAQQPQPPGHEVTQQEFDRMIAQNRFEAERFGRRNPFH